MSDDARVDPGNTDQYERWNGETGERWVRCADQFDRMIAPFHDLLIDAAAVQATERVLDVGCGTGSTSRQLAESGLDCQVLGIDIAAKMLQLASERATSAELLNVKFEQRDAQIADMAAESFDLVVSRFGVMFFADPVAAFTNLSRMTRDDGRLVMMVWRDVRENPWMMQIIRTLSAGRPLAKRESGAPGPFALADADRVRHILSEAGWADIQLRPCDGEMLIGDSVEDALRVGVGLGDWILEDMNDQERSEAVERLRSRYSELSRDGAVYLSGAVWLITARAPSPAGTNHQAP